MKTRIVILTLVLMIALAPTVAADPPDPIPCLDGPTELCVPPPPSPGQDPVLWLLEDVLGLGPCTCDPEPTPW